MKHLIKAEFRKLFTVRSTYIITAIALLMVGFISFYVQGMRAGEVVNDPKYLTNVIFDGVNFIAGFISLIALLLMSHEFRYNTITYTLTSANSRTKVLIAKIAAVTVFTTALILLMSLLSPLLAYLGTQINDLEVARQTIDYGNILWRVLFAGFGNAMAGLLVAALIRNQVGSLAALFLIPTTAETLLTLLLKQKAIYLPFSALNEVISTVNTRFPEEDGFVQGRLSPGKGALVFSVYLIVGWVIAWLLFLRRDAS